MQTYPWNSADNFLLLAGPRQEVQAIVQEEEAVISGAEMVREMGGGGAYALFYVKWKRDRNMEQWKQQWARLTARVLRAPACEAVQVNYTGTWTLACALLGEERWSVETIYDRDEAPAWAELLLWTPPGVAQYSGDVRFTWENGETMDFPYHRYAAFDDEDGKLSLARLAEGCNPYAQPAKRRAFYQSFREKIPSLEGIAAVELRMSKLQRADGETLARLSQLEGAAEAGDLSRLWYFQSFVENAAIWRYNLKENTAAHGEFLSVFLPKDPDHGSSDYTHVTLRKTGGDKVPLQRPAEDEASLLWDEKNQGTCLFCFSDQERIAVPPENPDTHAPAEEIGEACFQGLANVKRIILPNTIKAIGPGAFAGCKKLEYVSFQDDPDSQADFVLRKKGDLLTLFTKKTAYEIPRDITKVGKFAFSSCSKLKSVTLHGKLKPLLKDSLAGCKSLKTVVLQPDVKAVEWLALARGNIQTVVLADGTQVRIYDLFMYNCFTQSEAGIGFDYAKAAQRWQEVKKESSRFQFCLELLTEHLAECGEQGKAIADFAIRYCLGKGDGKTLQTILEKTQGLELDTERLVELANRSGQTEAAAMLLNHRTGEPEEKKIVVRRETPAEHKWPWFRYIQVRFENNKAYKYRCDFDVHVGDKVFVEGKMAGQPGEVTALLPDRPSGRAELYTQSVTEAYNITTEEVDSLFSLD